MQAREKALSFPSPHEVVGRGQGWGVLYELMSRKDKRVPRARQLRREMTLAERKLWWRLREFAPSGSHFRRQAPIGPYFADFACHTTKLVIEIDGSQHGKRSHINRDLKREAYLKRNGYRVLRFWNSEVRENVDGVLNVIWDELKTSTRTPPTPDPSPPQAGGGEMSTNLPHKGRGE
jgi:very-short-patch-repair endonuclease